MQISDKRFGVEIDIVLSALNFCQPASFSDISPLSKEEIKYMYSDIP